MRWTEDGAQTAATSWSLEFNEPVEL